MNDFHIDLERMVRMRRAELHAVADRERLARTARHIRFVWVRRGVGALGGRLAGVSAPKVARERVDG